MSDAPEEVDEADEIAEANKCVPQETDVTKLCEVFSSQLDKFKPETVETLAAPTTLRGGKEAFVAFRYGGKKFKVTFEQIDRLRIPKEAKDG